MTKITILETEFKATQVKLIDMESKLKKKKKKLRSVTIKLEKAEEKVAVMENKAEQAAKEAAKEAVKDAIKNYEELSTFQDKLHEAGVESYDHGRADCLKKVKRFYPNLDNMTGFVKYFLSSSNAN